MANFTNHTVDSAPAASKPILEGAQQQLGFVPNLYAKLAESASALKAYMGLSGHFEKSSLDPTEQQIVLLTASVENGCEFCVAAHSVIAKNMVGVDAEVVDAIRSRQPIADDRLEALAGFTRQVVRERGWVNGAPADAFLAAGYNHENALDVVLGVTLKTLSNYSNHLTDTQVNEEFAAEAWSKDG